MTYAEYRKDFLEILRNESAINGTDSEDEFLNKSLTILRDFDEIDDVNRIEMGDKKGKNGRLMKINGYSVDETDHSLILFISDFQDTFEPQNITMTRVDELYWRMYNFLDEVCNGSINDYFDDSDDILKVAKLIRKRLNASQDDLDLLLKVKFFILTNKELDIALKKSNLLETTIRRKKGVSEVKKTSKKIKKTEFNNKPLEVNLWHIERFYEMESSNKNESIILNIEDDFKELGYKGIPCIKGNIGSNLGYEAYIAIIPGNLLAQIYIEYGSKVLEGNVRAFLGAGGSKSVNGGIKRTINNEPSKFFTYNNGIATTASNIEIEDRNGELLITKIEDLQIINGGQTTASLAEAVLKSKKDLSGIYVPMKLTVIEDRETENEDGIRFYDQMIKNIATYANSQNKVTAADLFSNDPFHIFMEKISKKHLAPPVRSAIPTGWYYERSRKKYLQEQFKLKGKEATNFLLKFPKKQVITKEQLAMYVTTIDCRPDIVSKGKNFVMKYFGEKVSEDFSKNKDNYNDFYFEKCICAAIIFRKVDEYLETNKDCVKHPSNFWYKAGGYKLNIVPYTIAKILSSIPSGYSLDWNEIWEKQDLPPAFMREVEIVTKQTNDFISNSHGVIVTEYCKKNLTWETYKEDKTYSPSKEFLDNLVPVDMMKQNEKSAKKEQKAVNELQLFMDNFNMGSRYWKNILEKGNSKKILSYVEQSALTEMCRMIDKVIVPQSKSGKLPLKTLEILKTITNVKEKMEIEGLL